MGKEDVDTAGIDGVLVDVGGEIPAHRSRVTAAVVGKDIVGVIVEAVDFSAQEPAPQGEVQTQVVGKGLFPAQVLVGDTGSIVGGGCIGIVVNHLAALGILAQEHEGAHVVTAQQAGTGAKLEVVEEGNAFQEIFLGSPPTQGHGREESPAGLRHAGELIGAVQAAGKLGQVLFVVVVADTAHVAGAAGSIAGSDDRRAGGSTVTELGKQGKRKVLNIGAQVVGLVVANFGKDQGVHVVFSETGDITDAGLSGEGLCIPASFSQFVAVCRPVHVHAGTAPGPGAVCGAVTGDHIVGRRQVFVVGIGVVIGSAHLQLQAFHPRNVPCDGHVGLGRKTLRKVVAGQMESGKGAVRGSLVVGHGTGIVLTCLFGKERPHADGLMRDGEISHLVGGAGPVRSAGKEPGRAAVSHHTVQPGRHREVFAHLGLHIGAEIET